MPRLAHVECLSDDDASGVVVQPPCADPGPDFAVVPPQPRKRQVPGDRSVVSLTQVVALRQQIRSSLRSVCRCCRKASVKALDKKNCLANFRDGDGFDKVLDLRKKLLSMSKEDADKKVLGHPLFFGLKLYLSVSNVG